MKQRYYGEPPVVVGNIELHPEEMLFYQYLPIKMANSYPIQLEDRLRFLVPLIEIVLNDFENEFGWDRLQESYVYLTAKYMFQSPGKEFNRKGYHSDGFMTDDINYIWSDIMPTVFNSGPFNLDLDDKVSMQQMEAQALPENEYTHIMNSILRLDQYNIHKVNVNQYAGMRCFVKISFSKDRYDLQGNSHNYKFDYNWKMKARDLERNIPQSTIKKK